MADSKTKQYGEDTWACLIAEAVDSSGGTAGDGQNLTLTETTPTNNYMFLFANKVKKMVKSKDKTDHLVQARSMTTKLGTIVQTVTVSQAIVPGKDITDLNSLDDQLDEWMITGNGQTGVKAIYFVARMKVSGNWRYKTFRNANVTQNWLKCEIKSYSTELTNERILISLQLEESSS